MYVLNSKKMKSKILTISILCFSKILLAQDSMRVETVVDTAFKTPQYIAAYDDVFLSHQETKWLLKADLIGLLGIIEGKNRYGTYTFSKPIGLEFEHKLSKTLSINTGISGHSQLGYTQGALLLEPRWYFNKNKLAADNPLIDNLNGSYLSLRAKATRRFLTNENLPYERKPWSLKLNYGIQKRVFNNFYVNYRVGMGYGLRENLLVASRIIEDQGEDWFFDSDFTLGLAFGGGKKKVVNTCDLFRCFETEKSLWKFDITKLVPSFNNFFQASDLSMAYEFKLGQSKAWSMNIGFDGYLSRLHFGNAYSSVIGAPKKHNFYTAIGYFSLAPRYYYNINKNIAKGISANNLSGCYLSLEIGLGMSAPSQSINIGGQSASVFIANQDYNLANSWKIIPKWGVQKRLFKRGFVDFSFAPYWYQETTKSLHPLLNHQYKNHNFFKSDFKIGFAF
jgi:hypothetical protein